MTAAEGRPDIGFVLPNLAGGGAQRVTLTLAGALAARGRRVGLALLRLEGPLTAALPRGVRVRYRRAPDREALRGCRERGVEARPIAGGPLAAAGAWRAMRRRWPGLPSASARARAGSVLDALAVRRYLREERPRLLYAAVQRANAAALAAVALEDAAPPVVVSEHTSVRAYYGPAQRARARVLYPLAAAVVAVSRGAAEETREALGLDAARVRRLPNPVPVAEVRRRAAEPLDCPWFGAGEPPVILSVGRDDADKDHDTLVRAFGEVRRRRPARLVLLGDFPPPSRARLLAAAEAEGAADGLAFAGYDANPYRWMRRAAAFAFSSRAEALPTVLIEALACGAPIASTDTPHGPREILEDGRWGALAPVGDAGALARAILGALGGGEGSAEGRMRRAADFDAERVAAAYEELFCGLTAARPAGAAA